MTSIQKKYVVLVLALLLNVTETFAQAYMDSITEKSCSCLEQIVVNTKPEDFNMKLGICMLEAASPYKKQLKQDHGIDLDKNDDSGEQLGRMVGMKMATKCPTALMKMVNQSKETSSEEKNIRGVITKIETEQFVVFSLKDEMGKISKFYWFTFIESAMELSSKYKSLVGKTVNITFTIQDYFDPKIDEYRPISMIRKMDMAE